MPEKIRWGLLSTAAINDSFIGALRQAGRSTLVAVASRTTAKARAYADDRGIPKAYGSYEALLGDPDVEVIYNPLPNSLHCEWTVRAAAAGKHVLCEKPLVLTLADADRVEAAAAANDVTIFEAFAYWHHPQMQKAHALVEAGRLGELQLITGWHAFYLPPHDRDNIRLNPALGGGALWDVGIYPVSQAVLLAGAGLPLEVWGCQIPGESGVDIALSGQMRFANGVIAHIWGGMRTSERYGLHIVGSQGTLALDNPSIRPDTEENDQRMTFTTSDGRSETIITPAKDAYLTEVEMMEACVLDGAEPSLPLDRSREILRCVLALYRSAATGKLVAP